MTNIVKQVIGDAILYCGDCAEVFPLITKADAVVTDPPYGIGAGDCKRGGTQRGNAIAPSKDYGRLDWDSKAPPTELIDLIISMGKWAVIFGGNYFQLPPSSCWLVWDKVTGNNGYADCELDWTNLECAVRKFTWQWKGMLQKDMKNKEERLHPTQKPIPVMKWCIGRLPEGCHTILDPFMGSWTTGVACVQMGKRFIGIEREPKYFEIACKRIAEAYAQPDMFIMPQIPEPAKPADLFSYSAT